MSKSFKIKLIVIAIVIGSIILSGLIPKFFFCDGCHRNLDGITRCAPCPQPPMARLAQKVNFVLYPFQYDFFVKIQPYTGEFVWSNRFYFGILLEAIYIFIITVIAGFFIKKNK